MGFGVGPIAMGGVASAADPMGCQTVPLGANQTTTAAYYDSVPTTGTLFPHFSGAKYVPHSKVAIG